MQRTQENINNVYEDYFYRMFVNNPKKNYMKLKLVFSKFKNMVNSIIQDFIDCNDQNYISYLMKFLEESRKKGINYDISSELLEQLDEMTLYKGAKYFFSQYQKKELRLITLYDFYKDRPKILDFLSKESEKKSNNIKIDFENIEKNYFDKSLAEFDEDKKEKYLKLPFNFQIFFIEQKNLNSYNILKEIINDRETSLYGLDSEWKEPKSFLEYYDHCLEEDFEYSDLIQISSKNKAYLLDAKSFNKDDKLKELFINAFDGKEFLAYSFENDLKKMNKFFSDFFKKQKIIDISILYKEKKEKKDIINLCKVCKELFGKELRKADQISDWKKRPLLKTQLNYAALDAYVLLQIYDKIK